MPKFSGDLYFSQNRNILEMTCQKYNLRKSSIIILKKKYYKKTDI